MDTPSALKLAQGEGLDLVVINFKSRPPLAKIIDWGKHQYLQNKNKKQRKSIRFEIKEIQIKVNIEAHDLLTKVKKAQKFIDKFGKIRVSLMLRGRENIYPEKAYEIIDKFKNLISGQYDQPVKRMGNRFQTIIKKSDETKDIQISRQKN
ncbi:MAG: translation initiation factor IF-3 [Candidatus Berkelbacteria bacterium Licking1014_7]|uniref:Translation initiation factor IF-3 n=1 Tax=Candidatus Berkelbacteria bacterium Licking1014_7 TaxID=2017147 RepID=A0A554LLB3_9BACT|nr:MAG: translation initiation factor IF-3 [Candidatus Berkelbacteria bacterium Licking1014_7]